MKFRFPLFKSGPDAFSRFLGVLLMIISTVSSSQAETSTIPLQEQLNRVQSKLALIKTDIIHQYQSDTAVFERPSRSSNRSAPPDSASMGSGKEDQASATPRRPEANLREIAVLMKRVERGSDSAATSKEGGLFPTDEMRLLLADRLLRANLIPQSEQTLKDLATQTHRAPIAAEAWFGLEKLYYRKGDYQQALGAFSKIPMSKTLPLRQEATYLAGNSYFYLKEYLKAIDLLSKIGEGSDYYPFALYSSGLAYLNMGDAWSSTQLQFQKLTALDPGEDAVLQELINKTRMILGFFFLDQKRPAEAPAVFEAIPTRSPYWLQARFGVGRAYMGMEDCVKAIVVFKDLIEKAPTHPSALEARLQIGNCYSKLSAYRRAVDSYREALKAYSERSEDLKKLIQKVQATNLENWISKSGTGTGPRFISFEQDLTTEHGFPELMNAYADWFQLNHEIAELGQRGKDLAIPGKNRDEAPASKTLQIQMQDVRRDLIELLRAATTDYFASKTSQIDGLALRANIGFVKNMTFMQDHETIP